MVSATPISPCAHRPTLVPRDSIGHMQPLRGTGVAGARRRNGNLMQERRRPASAERVGQRRESRASTPEKNAPSPFRGADRAGCEVRTQGRCAATWMAARMEGLLVDPMKPIRIEFIPQRRWFAVWLVACVFAGLAAGAFYTKQRALGLALNSAREATDKIFAET